MSLYLSLTSINCYSRIRENDLASVCSHFEYAIQYKSMDYSNHFTLTGAPHIWDEFLPLWHCWSDSDLQR